MCEDRRSAENIPGISSTRKVRGNEVAPAVLPSGRTSFLTTMLLLSKSRFISSSRLGLNGKKVFDACCCSVDCWPRLPTISEMRMTTMTMIPITRSRSRGSAGRLVTRRFSFFLSFVLFLSIVSRVVSSHVKGNLPYTLRMYIYTY